MVDTTEASDARDGQTAVPRRFGDYTVEAVIGRGGCGTVYAARDDRGRSAAVKVAGPGTSERGRSDRARLSAEGAILAELDSPHIPAVKQLGRLGEWQYLVLELAEGGPLSSRIKRGLRADPESMAACAAAIAGALRVVHTAGYVHRDVTPANLLIRGAGKHRPQSLLEDAERVLLADFGLTSRTGTAADRPWDLVGHSPFVAPELAERRRPVGPAADIYAATAVVTTLLTGRMPPTQQQRDGFLDLLQAQWADFIACGMHAEPQHRFSSIDDWHERITDLLEPDLKEAE